MGKKVRYEEGEYVIKGTLGDDPWDQPALKDNRGEVRE